MRSTWATIDGICDLLKEAQLNDGTVPFPLTADLDIYQFQPPDFMFDGMMIQPGMYVYFNNTDFELPDGGIHDVSHTPEICIDFAVSEKAEISASTDVVTFSNDVAEARLRTVTSQVYDALTDTRFLRLLNAKINANVSVAGEFSCSQLWINKAMKLGTLRFTKSSTAISLFRFILAPGIAEVHTNNQGITYEATDDRITPYRREEDFGAEE